MKLLGSINNGIYPIRYVRLASTAAYIRESGNFVFVVNGLIRHKFAKAKIDYYVSIQYVVKNCVSSDWFRFFEKVIIELHLSTV